MDPNLIDEVQVEALESHVSEARICGGCGSEITSLDGVKERKMNGQDFYFCSSRCTILFTRMLLKLELLADHIQAKKEASDRQRREEEILLSV